MPYESICVHGKISTFGCSFNANLMKTILLPTDFSDESKNAIRYAINLYGTQDVRYIALHAYDLQHHNTTMMISKNAIRETLAPSR